MTGNLRKLFAFIMVIVLLTLMGACGGTEKKTGDSGTNIVDSSGLEKTGEEKEQEVITLTVGSCIEDGVSGIQNDSVVNEIEKKFAIKIDWMQINDRTEEKVQAMIAANDLLDIMYIHFPERHINNLVNGKLIKPLDELVGEYGSNLSSDPDLKVRMWFARKYNSPDGKLYVIRTGGGSEDVYNRPLVGNYIRWDAYKLAGKPEITTHDELLEVLAEMQKAMPTTEDGKKIYGMGAWFGEGIGWGDWPFATIPFSRGYYGAGQSRYTRGYDIEGMKMMPTCQITDPGSVYWDTIKWLYKAKQMGILDPDSFTQKADQYEAKLKEGRYLWTFPNWLVRGANDAFRDTEMGEDVGFVVVPPLDNTDKLILRYSSGAGARAHVIAESCEYPEKAMQLLDFVSSKEGSRLLNSGIQGENWDIIDGIPEFNDNFLDKEKKREGNHKTGEFKYSSFAGFLGTTMLNDGNVANLNLSGRSLARNARKYENEAYEYWKFPDPNFNNPQLKHDTFDDIYDQCMPEVPEDMKKSYADLNDYCFKEQYKAILAKTDEEFEKSKQEIIEKAKLMKAEEIFNWQKAQYDALAAEINEQLAK